VLHMHQYGPAFVGKHETVAGALEQCLADGVF
jgi:hypothetical protein